MFVLAKKNIAKLAVLFLCSFAVLSASTESFESVVDERQKGFKKMGGAMKKMNGIIKSGEEDFPSFISAATDILETAPKVVDWFPSGSGSESGLETDALSYIWKKPEKFSASNDKLITEAEALLSLAKEGADSGALMKQLRAVKNSCSTCHKSFRAD